MRYCALLMAVMCLSLFVLIGCDNPPQPSDPTVYDRDLDGDPNIHTLDAVVVVEKIGDSSGKKESVVSEEVVEEVEAVSEESAAQPEPATPEVVTPPVNPFVFPTKPAEAVPAPALPTPTPAEPKATPEASEVPAAPASVDQPQKDVLKKMADAVRSGNKAEFMECVYVQSANRPFVFELVRSFDNFNAKMKETYGQDAVKGSKSDLLPSAEDIDDKIEITVSGNSAIVKMQDQGQTLRMLKQNDKWLVDVLRDIPLGNDAGRSRAVFNAAKGVIAKAEKKIGMPGYNAKRINDELQNEMMGAASGAVMADGLGDALKKMNIRVGR